MKKMVATGMALIMATSSTSFVLAGPNESINAVDKLIVSGVYDLNEVVELADGTKKYNITVDGIETDIMEKEMDEGIVYTFNDGCLIDEVVLTSAGDIILNGKTVKVTEEEIVETRSISPRAYIETWETSSTPYASGPYNVGGALQKSTVELDQKINQVTLSALAMIVVTAILGPVSGVSAAKGAYAGLDEAYSWIKAANPDAENLYVERRIWTNGNPNTSSSPMEFYSWIEVNYYEDKDSTICRGEGSFYALQKITNH